MLGVDSENRAIEWPLAGDRGIGAVSGLSWFARVLGVGGHGLLHSVYADKFGGRYV